MNKIICHIPHSSIIIPDWAKEQFIISSNELQSFALKMQDKYILELFDFAENKLILPISRIVVDVERYRNDNIEPMAKIGMGLYYLKDDKGNIIRKDCIDYRNKIYEIYDNHHKYFEAIISNFLKNEGFCYILDCHSFHKELNYTKFDNNNYPDICIGFNENIPPIEALEIKTIFENNGYTVKFNNPFEGSIIPLKYLNDNNVKSIMLEINRNVCDSEDKFTKTKELCIKTYKYLENKKRA